MRTIEWIIAAVDTFIYSSDLTCNGIFKFYRITLNAN
jgi:hypothetical protein